MMTALLHQGRVQSHRNRSLLCKMRLICHQWPLKAYMRIILGECEHIRTKHDCQKYPASNCMSCCFTSTIMRNNYAVGIPSRLLWYRLNYGENTEAPPLVRRTADHSVMNHQRQKLEIILQSCLEEAGQRPWHAGKLWAAKEQHLHLSHVSTNEMAAVDKLLSLEVNQRFQGAVD